MSRPTAGEGPWSFHRAQLHGKALYTLDEWASRRLVLMGQGTSRLMANQTDNQTVQYGEMELWWQNAGAVRA